MHYRTFQRDRESENKTGITEYQEAGRKQKN